MMSEERPRPQYGEYATPEQQAQAMGKRPIPPLRVQPEMPAPPDPATRVSDPGQRAALAPAVASGHPIDRMITIVLLGLGLFQLLDSIGGFLDFRVTLNQLATAFGLSFAAPAAATQAGYWILAANVVLLLLTAVVAIRVVRGSHIAFYIPLIGYLVFEIVMVTIVMTTVPSFADLMASYLASAR
jgi:hypothetical protein